MLFISYFRPFYACWQSHLFPREKVAVLPQNVQNDWIVVISLGISKCQMLGEKISIVSDILIMIMIITTVMVMMMSMIPGRK